ncbi:MAG: leucine-rich repeat protein [Lachnospiraceae bacterium]|nr:leucine-rich repeat protein [Lachnospiraceae bacterium]
MLISKKQYEDKMNKSLIPDISDEEVPKKALLGNRMVDIIFVPYGVKRIGDWAFAYCVRLKEIWLPDTIKDFGKEVFLDDMALEKIVVYSEQEKGQMYYANEDISELLAIAIKCFKKSEVYDFSNIYDESWLDWFDDNLITYIDETDEAGFNPFLAGGEEDYEDPENDIDFYMKKQREKKCGAILVRLKFENEPSADYMDKYKSYIETHKKDTIMFILEKKHESFNYLKIYAEHEFIKEAEIPYLLEAFSDEQYIDSKAYIIKYKEHNTVKKNIWDDFKL